jgi:hypothetical protein
MALVASPEDVRQAFDGCVHDLGSEFEFAAPDVVEEMTTGNLLVQAMGNADVNEITLSGGGCVMSDLPSTSDSAFITSCEQDFLDKLVQAVIGLGLSTGKQFVATSAS